MPTKTPNTLAKQQQQHFKWYYAIILVGVVAIAGILILRFSQAGTVKIYKASDSEMSTSANKYPQSIYRNTDLSLPGPVSNQVVWVFNSGYTLQASVPVNISAQQGDIFRVCVEYKLNSPGDLGQLNFILTDSRYPGYTASTAPLLDGGTASTTGGYQKTCKNQAIKADSSRPLSGSIIGSLMVDVLTNNGAKGTRKLHQIEYTVVQQGTPYK